MHPSDIKRHASYKLLRRLGRMGEGDVVHVRAIAPKNIPAKIAFERKMGYEVSPGEYRVRPVSGELHPRYLKGTLIGVTYKQHYANGNTKEKADGLDYLRWLNNCGYGIYFVVNPGGTEDEQIKAANSIFFECDDVDFDEQRRRIQVMSETLAIAPTIVRTAKSLHTYFSINRVEKLDAWKKVQQQLIQAMESDPSIHNPARLMRLPGFYHCRWDKEKERIVRTPVELEAIAPEDDKIEFFALQNRLPKWDEGRWNKQAAANIGHRSGEFDNSPDNPFNLRNFAHYLEGYKEGGRRNGWATAKCPAHNGESSDSLHIAASGAFKCHSGCASQDIYARAKEIAVAHGYQFPVSDGRVRLTSGLPKSQRLSRKYRTVEGVTRYLADTASQVPLAELCASSLVAIAAPQGSGKTTFLKQPVNYIQAKDEPVWFFTYRRSLERTYSRTFGLCSKEEARESTSDWNLGLGGATCIHSLRPDSKAGFTAEGQRPGMIVIDEARSVLAELVDSSLVDRGAVIPEFIEFARRCHKAGYPIFLMDAHLTDAEVDTMAKIIGIGTEDILVIRNNHKVWEGRQVRIGDMASVQALMVEAAKTGKTLFITTTSQKEGSIYGTVSLERAVLTANPGLKVLRIDSKTVHQLGHAAAEFMAKLEEDEIGAGEGHTGSSALEYLKNFDVIIVSPVIEAGVSIDLYGWFDEQYSFLQGNLPAENCIQQMLRVRDKSVPLFIGEPARGRGMDCAMKRGNGKHTAAEVADGERKRIKGNLIGLTVTTSVDEDCKTVAAPLDYWYQHAARLNESISIFTESVIAYLTEMGCECSRLGEVLSSEEKKQQKAARKRESREAIATHAQKVAEAEEISIEEAQLLSEAKLKTAEESLAIERAAIAHKYQVPVSAGLVQLEATNNRVRRQALLLYYAALETELVKVRDQKKVDRLESLGPKFLPDLNKGLMGLDVRLFQSLILPLLKRQGELLTNESEPIVALRDALDYYGRDLGDYLGIEMQEGWSNVRRANYLSERLLGLPVLRTGKRLQDPETKKRTRTYEVLDILVGKNEAPVLDEAIAAGQLDMNEPGEQRKLEDAYRRYLMAYWYQNGIEPEQIEAPAPAQDRQKEERNNQGLSDRAEVAEVALAHAGQGFQPSEKSCVQYSSNNRSSVPLVDAESTGRSPIAPEPPPSQLEGQGEEVGEKAPESTEKVDEGLGGWKLLLPELISHKEKQGRILRCMEDYAPGDWVYWEQDPVPPIPFKILSIDGEVATLGSKYTYGSHRVHLLRLSVFAGDTTTHDFDECPSSP